MNTLSHDSQFNPIPLASLLSRDLPDPQCIIPDLLPQGLTFLLGQPRIGKSWLALQIALSTALSTPILGQTPIHGADVLYLGLQDTPRRISSRCRKLLGDQPIPSDFTWANQWNPLHPESLAALDHWLTEHPETRLLVIDSLDLLHPPVRRSSSVSQQEHPLLSQLRALADQHRLAILLVASLSGRSPISHARDPLTDLSRIPALRAADALVLLTRERGQADATLLITGSGLPDQELALSLQEDTMRWTLLGPAAAYRLSQQRQDILALLREYEGGPLSPKQIASLLHKDVRAVTKLLFDMSHAGQLRMLGRGQYMLAKIPSSDSHHNPNSSALHSAIGNNGNNSFLKMETQQGKEGDGKQNGNQHMPGPLPHNSPSTTHQQSSNDDISNESNIGNGSNSGNIGNVAGGEPANFLPFSDSNLFIPLHLEENTNQNEGHNPYFPID